MRFVVKGGVLSFGFGDSWMAWSGLGIGICISGLHMGETHAEYRLRWHSLVHWLRGRRVALHRGNIGSVLHLVSKPRPDSKLKQPSVTQEIDHSAAFLSRCTTTGVSSACCVHVRMGLRMRVPDCASLDMSHRAFRGRNCDVLSKLPARVPSTLSHARYLYA